MATQEATPESIATTGQRGSELGRKPAWLKVQLPGGQEYTRLKDLVGELGLHTVCEEARCPNLGECWRGDAATMTIMVLGDVCTRRCRFCAVDTASQGRAIDAAEPGNVGRAVARLKLSYVVITSVDRDDLSDGGAAHYAACVESVRARAPQTIVETLIPDYLGADLEVLMASRPAVLGHNVEVVERLQRKVRDPQCSLERSLATLRRARELAPGALTKSSLMVGLGESRAEVLETMQALRSAEVDLLTVGQYLRPSARHAPVREYVKPEQFSEYEDLGLAMGFRHVASGPLVRSSYRAAEHFARLHFGQN
ncbi:MAG: lipoyl synthase [Planctomycetes bacterium]|jgi:lipoic acid synthetase|nr:lipoyl synthase [Planctomycetota bacterium]HJO25994.1 lipoyl synthase [Planctomycetota bacterium]